MGHWNHRVVKRTFKNHDGSEDSFYAIHEAYYDDNNKVFAITDSGVAVRGETIEELKQSLDRMNKALETPVLDYDSIPEEGCKDPIDERD